MNITKPLKKRNQCNLPYILCKTDTIPIVTSLLFTVNRNQCQGMYVEFGLYIHAKACLYHDREQHLRRDDHRPQGKAVREGIVRYGHQGGGQRQ